MLDADLASWLIGLIWALFCGLAIGNYATNPIYRLPLNEPLFGRKPYCGDCNALLKPKDLFPILSWFSTGGKCRYCGARVPAAYVVAEILITALFVTLYWRIGFGDEIILIGLGGTALIMMVMMEVIDRFFSNKTWLFFIVMGALLRTLQESSIGGITYGVFYTALVSLIYWWWGVRAKPEKGALPNYVKLWVGAGIWLKPEEIILFALIWFALEVIIRIASAVSINIRGRFPLSASYALALLTLILFPKLAGLPFSIL
jgi:leader peptidase (prepilin peptidase)/N-methyltransferase